MTGEAVEARTREAAPPEATAPGAGRFLTLAVTAISVGATEAVIAVSFAGLVFGPSLPDLLPAGIGVALFGAAAVLLVTGLLATVPGTLGSAQDAPVAILAVTVAGMAPGLAPGSELGTVLVTIAIATGVTGLGLFVLGLLRLGELVRYIPFPVIGGFLAGSGWIILDGAFSFLADRDVHPGDLGALADVAVWPRTLLGVLLGVVLLVGIRRWGATVTLPAVVLGATAVFYATVLLGPDDVDGAAAGGWLLSGIPDGRLWPPAGLSAGLAIDWGAVLGAAPGILALLAVSAVSLLLNASGIELSARRDVDLDRELRAAGAGNVLAAVGGGLPGFQAVSLTAMAHRADLHRRAVAVLSAIAVAAVLLLGGDVVALLPRPVLGAVLVFLGLAFLHEWLIEGRKRLTLPEYGVVLLITVVIAVVGVIQGVLVGLVATVVLFTVSYSNTAVVKHRMTSASYRSPVDRSPVDTARLRELGTAIVVLELQGFLFFGTSRSVLDRVRQELQASSEVRFVVLDLHRVAGLDSSSALAFAKIAQLVERHGVTLVLSGASDDQELQLRRPDGIGDHVPRFPDLDSAAQWCEDELLGAGSAEPDATSVPDLLLAALGDPRLVGRLADLLEEVRVPAGQPLIVEGDEADALYLLSAGVLTASIRVRSGASLRLRTMQPGTVVGEAALYGQTRRTATVVADTDASVLRLDRATIDRLDTDDPELAAALHRWVARLLADRLSTSLATIAALRD